jgi:hypothetical protein
MKLWTGDELEVLISNYSTMEGKDLSKLLGRSLSSIKYKAKKLGLKRVWTSDELDIIKTNYCNTLEKDLLALLPNRTWEAIMKQARRLGLKRERYIKPDLLDFTHIDTQEKAYLLGYIAADGSVYNGPRHYGVAFCAMEDDCELLYKLRDIIYPSAKVHRYIKADPRGWNVKPQCVFYVYNKKMSQVLQKWGIHARKSFDLEFPYHIPENLYHHWVRGFCDGDGSISISKGIVYCHLIGTLSVLSAIKDIFFCVYSNKVSVRDTHPTKGIHVICWAGKTGIAFLNWIYKDATIYMKRKYDKAKPYLTVV